MSRHLLALSAQLGQKLQGMGLKIVTAESCTGGSLAAAITEVAGSSAWFDRGFITYTNQAKQEILGVKAETLAEYGAVSEPVVQQMAEGALANSHADIAMAITGIAGPAGGKSQKPVGTVWFAWMRKGDLIESRCEHFQGDRAQIRTHAVEFALRQIHEPKFC